MTINRKEKFLITIIIFTVIILLMIFLAVSPLFKGIKKNSEDFLSSKNELVSFKSQAENLEDFIKFYQENLSNLKKIDELFINSEVPLNFISFLEKISQDSKIKIKISLSSPKETKKEPWPSTQLQISATGSFSNFSKFIGKIKTAPYLIKIQNLNISRLTEDEIESGELKGFVLGDIKANLLIKVYTK